MSLEHKHLEKLAVSVPDFVIAWIVGDGVVT